MHCWKQQCLSFIDSKVNFYLGCFNYYMKFRVLILKLPDWIKKGYALCYSVVNLQGAAILWTLINTTTLLTGSQWSQEALTWTLFLNNESKFEEISDEGWNKQTKKKMFATCQLLLKSRSVKRDQKKNLIRKPP